jgi:hypothetical protein
MRTASLLIIITFCPAAATPSADQRPNLTGTWVATADTPKTLEKAPAPTLGPKFALTLEGNALVMLRPWADDTVRAMFTLDGSETRVRQPGRMCVGDSVSIETAAWDGDAIVHRRVGIVAAGSGEVRPANAHGVIRLDGPDTLVTELRIAATKDRPAREMGTVYKRSTTEKMVEPASIPAVTQTPATIKDVAWIGTMWAGKMQTLNVEERWTPPASGGLMAIARTLRGEQLASFEFLCIAERFGTLVYYAMPNGRTPATPFTLSALTPDSATFENPSHDFPKVIRYRRLEDGSLETTVSGANNERAQTMVLKRN